MHGMQVVERVRRKAAVYGQDITSSSSAPGLENGASADGARPAGCVPFPHYHPNSSCTQVRRFSVLHGRLQERARC